MTPAVKESLPPPSLHGQPPLAAPEFPLATRMILTLYALVITSVIAFSNMDESATSLVLVLFAAILAWLLIDSPARRAAKDPPQWIPNAIVLLAALNLLYEVVYDNLGQNVIISLSHFLVALAICKLFEKKRRRDVVQIIVISLLIAVASSMFSTSGLLFSMILAAYFALLFYAAMLINLGFEVQRLQVPSSHPSRPRRAIVMPAPASLNSFLRDIRLSAKQCLLLVIPFSLVIFLAMPRSRAASLATSWGIGGTFQTGFTDTVQFQDYGTLSQSDTVVMKVSLTRAGESVAADYNDLYFRGEVLDEYSRARKSWTLAAPEPSSSLPASLPLPTIRPDEQFPEDDADNAYVSERIKAHIELFVPSQLNLFVLAPIAEPHPAFTHFYERYQVLRAESLHAARYSYDINWLPNGRIPPKDYPDQDSPYIQPGLLRHAGQGADQVAQLVSPQINDLARNLAKDYLPRTGTQIARENIRPVIAVFENYLKANYPYSLTFKQVDGNLDPTTDFLLNRKKTGGHCEYFASAMVMLCRAVGLNSRMVVGYHGGEYNPIDESIIIRQRDAHAWAEIYLPEDGWITSDPSPLRRASDTDTSIGRWFHDISALVQNAWLTSVVAFDNDTRDLVINWLTVSVGQLAEVAASHLWITAGLTLCASGVLFLLFLGIRVWHRRAARKNPVHSAALHRAAKLPAHLLFLEQLLALFAKTAGTRRADQTPLEYLLPLIPALQNVRKDVQWLVHTAYAIEFGTTPLDASLRDRISQTLKRVKESLRSKR